MAERARGLVTRRLRRRVGSALDRRFGFLGRRIDASAAQVLAEIAELRAELGVVQFEVAHVRRAVADVGLEVVAARERGETDRQHLAQVRDDLAALRDQLPPVLRALVTEEEANRRRIEALRVDPDYAVPFDDPDPLVTICIPTHDRIELLTERSLPSVLAQTHRRLEVIVVGDGSPPSVEEAVTALGDDRIRFINLTHRHAPTDAERHWLVGSVQARNAGYEHATGHWIVDFDDDDALRPDAIELVVTRARERRLEMVYGKYATHHAEGQTRVDGRFPPAFHQFAWQGAAVHRGLRFIGRQTVAVAFGHPNDWFRIETMMRIGVRIGMVDDVLFDYYPARSWERPTPVPDNAFAREQAW